MNVRIVVADERQANFFDAATPKAPLTARGSLVNESGGKKDSELETDRPGRRYGGTNGASHAGQVGGHHHGVNGERSTEQHDLTIFAKEVAKHIDASRVRNEFDKLVLVAAPKMLGLLRQSLPTQSQTMIAQAISKDVVNQGPEVVLRLIPADTFFQ